MYSTFVYGVNVCAFQLLRWFTHTHSLAIEFMILFTLACSAAICPEPPEIMHGRIDSITGSGTGTCVGDTVHYACNEGFKLKGHPYITCEKVDNYTAAFDMEPPICHRKCCMNATE